MLSIFKKKKTGSVDLSEISTDMHSHLVPGIDDGSPDIETSLMLIKGLHDLGLKKFITTPHIMWDMYKNDESTINPPLMQLQQAVRHSETPVPIKAAAEYFLDDHFDDMLHNKAPLLTLKDKWVLVEFSFVSTPMNLKDKLFNLQINGYQPVLAHPERYLYFLQDRNWYDELKSAGCLFQLNILSLTGYYGKAPGELANYLIKKKYVDFLGTDLHHSRHLDALRTASPIMESIKALLDSGMILNPSL